MAEAGCGSSISSVSQIVTGTSIEVKNGAATAGYIDFYEDSSDGSNKVKLISQAMAGNITVTLPSVTGTLLTSGGDLSGNSDTADKILSITNSDIVQLTTTQTLTNKSLTSPTITGTGAIAGTFTGDLTGNVSGTSATVTGAAQTAITSVGTLTALQVDNININGNTISSTAGTDLLITPLGGQQIVLDGAIVIDSGVVTGATSITSTNFIGALTGNVTGNVTKTGGVNISPSLIVDNIKIDGNTISSTAGTDLLITPKAGEQIVLDSTIVIDAGVVTGATSITSTAFVGALTNCTGLPAAQVAQGTMASGMVLVAPVLGTPASGALTNCTGTAAALTAGTATVATTITVADESSDATCFPLFATAATGDLGPKSGTNLTFNSSSGLLTTTEITSTGVTTVGSLVGGSVDTEHGAGAIATSFAPITRRYTQNGVIITKIHFDLTGLGGKGGTANDVIGLPTGGGAAFIGRNVVSDNGVVYKAELACIELPAAASGSATVNIDIATNATATIAYDGAGGTAKLFDTGGMVAGQELSNITPALTANHYFYLVEGDTAATDGVYNAGQFILTLYGHAVA
jgi:hypothetical protein